MIALVTGPGSGLGEAIAERLARDGHSVAVNDLKLDAAEQVASRLREAGMVAEGFAADISSETEVARMASEIRAQMGGPGILVNNAGFAQQARFTDLAVADFDRMFAVHVRGSFLCTKAFLPGMLEAGEGIIVNVASNLGQIGGVELVHYSAANAAIIGMTKALAREVSAEGVRVNAVAPGPINTPLVQGLSEEWKAEKAAGLPLGRFGEAAEVARAVAFLCSADASLFVGQTLAPNSGDVML